MRLVFLGTPEAAVPTLEAVLDAGHEVVLVVTRPDRRRGRGSQLSPSPVKEAALRLGLEVTHRLADLANVEAQRGVVVAYGAMIPQSLLEKIPMLNVHFSLLPRWRGAAPVQRAILAGDEETGVAIISLEASLDTGPVHLERRIPVGSDSAEELTRRLAVLGAGALVDVLASPELLDHPTPQSGETTYAEKLTADTFRILPTMSSGLAWRTVRLGHAYFTFGPKRIGVVEAHRVNASPSPGQLFEHDGEIVLGVSDGGVGLTSVRPEGGKTMSARSWWSGLRPSKERRSWT
jgi:methionyl-tRNA formyltransferase